MKMNRAIVAAVLCAMLIAKSTQAEDHQVVANYIEADVAAFATVTEPIDVFRKILEGCDSDEKEINRIIDLLLFTNPTDGSERQTGPKNELLSFLTSIKSIHLVVANSKNAIGDFGILIDRRQDGAVPKETVRLIVQVAAQIAKRRVSLYSDDDLRSYLDRAGNNLDIAELENWFIVGSSKRFTQQLLASIKKGQALKPLSKKNRSFSASCKSSLKNSYFDFFVSYRNGKKLVLDLGISDEKSWKRKGFEEIPWEAVSARLETNTKGTLFDWKRTIATTLPHSGDAKYWRFYSEIDFFPPLPEDAVMVRGKSVDLAEWHAESKKDYEKAYGEKAYEPYESNPITAFHTGISRPNLGGVQFDFWDGSYDPGQLVLYEINDGTPKNQIMDYLSTYYQSIQKDSEKSGLVVDYQLTQVNETDAWWSEVFKDEFESSSNVFGAPGAGAPGTLDDSETEPNTKDEQRLSSSEQELKQKSPNEEEEDQPWLAGNGAVVFKNWVAMGSGKKIDSIADWEHNRLLTDSSSEELKDKVLNAHSRFGGSKFPHVFEYKRSRAVNEDITAVVEIIHQAMPSGWTLKDSDYAKIKTNPDLVLEHSRPVQLRYHFRKLVESFSSKAELLKVESFTRDMSKKIIGSTLRIEQVQD